MPGWPINWLKRHRHPASITLHLIGIPLTIIALGLAVAQMAWDHWGLLWQPAGLLAASYLLQWIGHRIEGNDMGEVILFKKWLGYSYVAISPRYAPKDDSPDPLIAGEFK